MSESPAPPTEDASQPPKTAGAKRKAAKSKPAKQKANPSTRGSRRARPFPVASFEDSLFLATSIIKFAPAGRIRRLTLFDELKKSPDSGPSRQLITNSNAYGLTEGSYQAEFLQVTDDGTLCVSDDVSASDRFRARFRLAIDHIAPFKALFESHAGGKLPSRSVLRDFLSERGILKDDLNPCIDTFVSNAQFVGLIKTVAGAERLLTLDHAVEQLPADSSRSTEARKNINDAEARSSGSSDLSDTCFYISPIGDDTSEERRHSDMFLESFVKPAIEELKDLGVTKVVRADEIGEPGMISTQVLQYLRHARLCIADLSFVNPNVMYEMALRHARKLPVVQIKRKQDRLPFDVNQVRTMEIDTTSIYTLLPMLESLRSQLATLARSAIVDPERVGNPITVFYPEYYD